MSTDPKDDMKVVFAVADGDEQAFNTLVQKYQGRVMSLVRRYIDDPIEAVDVVQEVFIKSFRALPNFRGDCAFYTWLYRIAVNTAKNHAVAHHRKYAEINKDISELEFLIEPGADGLSKQPEFLLYRSEINGAIDEIVSGLPEDLRMALKLRDMDGLTYDEIAHIMSCPIGTVRSRIYRARDTIHRKIKPML